MTLRNEFQSVEKKGNVATENCQKGKQKNIKCTKIRTNWQIQKQTKNTDKHKNWGTCEKEKHKQKT